MTSEEILEKVKGLTEDVASAETQKALSEISAAINGMQPDELEKLESAVVEYLEADDEERSKIVVTMPSVVDTPVGRVAQAQIMGLARKLVTSNQLTAPQSSGVMKFFGPLMRSKTIGFKDFINLAGLVNRSCTKSEQEAILACQVIGYLGDKAFDAFKIPTPYLIASNVHTIVTKTLDERNKTQPVCEDKQCEAEAPSDNCKKNTKKKKEAENNENKD